MGSAYVSCWFNGPWQSTSSLSSFNGSSPRSYSPRYLSLFLCGFTSRSLCIRHTRRDWWIRWSYILLSAFFSSSHSCKIFPKFCSLFLDGITMSLSTCPSTSPFAITHIKSLHSPQYYAEYQWQAVAFILSFNIVGLIEVALRQDIIWAIAGTWVMVGILVKRPKPMPVFVSISLFSYECGG